MDMKALSSHFTTMHAQKGEYLFHEGGDVRGLFIICEGEVKITKSVDTKKAK
jgi:CRP-like cAMP-binding protein